MEKSPTDAERQKMSDVALAHSYVADIGGTGRVKEILARAYRKLAEQFPHDDEPDCQWTERRVRAFWSKEAATVQFREMLELHQAAEFAKAERVLIEKAKAEHAEFVTRTARLKAMLENADPDFFSDQVAGIGSELGRMAGAGDRRP